MGEIVVSENMKQYESGKASVMAMNSSGKAINMMSLRVYVSWRDGKMFEHCFTGVLFLCIQNKFVEFQIGRQEMFMIDVEGKYSLIRCTRTHATRILCKVATARIARY